MEAASISFNASLHAMKSRVTRYSIYGLLIAATAVVVATMITAVYIDHHITIKSLLRAQKQNVALWVLDFMLFGFAFWGQYVSTSLSKNVRHLVNEQTAELVQKTEVLERQAIHDTTHDSLTDLPNRILLRDRLDQALLAAQRNQRLVALLVLDLNRFKEINDTLGHFSGDRLLKQIAIRLREVVYNTDTLARLGGDEFAIVSSIASEEDVYTVIEKIQRAFASPFSLNKMQLDVQASIGVAFAPKHGQNLESLMQCADVAMYIAKEDKRHYYIYEAAMDKHSSRRLSMIAQLRQAITKGDLCLHYQPQIDTKTGQLTGVEALVRWNHNEYGLVPPDEFIYLAEQSGLITELSRWVLRTAVEQATDWSRQNKQINVAVNISPATLLDPDLPDFLAGLLASSRLPRNTLALEITELSLVRDPDLALDVLNQIVAMGVAIAIDDFGTGYSSMSYLKKMPASRLKIDKTFVADMLDNENDAAIVRATIGLAHDLGMQVIAEGVETEDIATALRELSCDSLQGYFFSPPLPLKALELWISAISEKQPEYT
ncbi:MAG: EAL domain-containing protein [Pseudomonadales bacterium]|nr:EAL domain-containing protein [Pseudomonadales bacterium]